MPRNLSFFFFILKFPPTWNPFFFLRNKHTHSSFIWEKGMEWKWMKKIILEYSSLLLFGSFNRGNGKLILLFRSLSRREWNEWEGTLIPLYSLKTSNFHSPRNWEEWEGTKLDLMIFLLKLRKYPCIFNYLF